MHSPSSSKSPSTSPTRLSPFSLAEFRALISAALDFDPCPAPRALPPHIDEPPRPASQKSPRRICITSLPPPPQTPRASTSKSVGTVPSVDSALFRLYLPLAAQYECAPLAFTCAPGSPPPSPSPSPDSSDSLSHSSRSSSTDHPYSFIPASTADPALEDADPFAKGAVRVVHRSYEALPSTYSYHSANNYSSCATNPRVRRTGRGRRVPIAPLIRVRARELDVELRELSGEAEVDEVEFAPTQFAIGKDEEQDEPEIDDSGIFLDENFTFVPARSSTPPPPSPSAAASKLTRAPTARTYPIAAAPSRHGRNARSGDARGRRALTPHPTPALAAFALYSPMLLPAPITTPAER
ncbi:hypothetical protein B0H14DRAFT_3632600 [Mycena olivaceomarginata]|nr:hypothetical protein B0H14DRAFT_3632600 [Mycena olivaceomarginata]